MDAIYIEYNFTIHPLQPASDILIAELGAVGFESFVETETGITAYIQQQDWNEEILADIFILASENYHITFERTEVAQTNWNAAWEENFEPIQVDGVVSVRAPFHKNPGLPFDIVIEPKMSFGTGHHQTTHMMIQQLLDLELTDLSVLDMGCGTGILAIFAEMKGAATIDAIDIDPWCYQNSLENVARNQCRKINVIEGGADMLGHHTYDVIVANINRNILLRDMDAYLACLNSNGYLLLSGFYREDIPLLENKVVSSGLRHEKTLERNNWISLRYRL